MRIVRSMACVTCMFMFVVISIAEQELRLDQKWLSREQAIADIDSLVYTISEVHPDMFFNCKPGEFMKMVNDAKNSVHDSVSVRQLYTLLQPIIVKIGDGHTSLIYPFKPEMRGLSLPRIPIRMTISSDNKVKVLFAIDNKIPEESEIISINGVPTDKMLEKMLCYQSGESEAFRRSNTEGLFNELFYVLYSSDSYNVTYRASGKGELRTTKLFPCSNIEYFTWVRKTQKPVTTTNNDPYSFKILPEQKVAIMDFKSFNNTKYMAIFADSMFAALKKNNITNLIIDVRGNGGGNSDVGDILLRYISPRPFTMFGKVLTRATPTTLRLINDTYIKRGLEWNQRVRIGWELYDNESVENMIQPRTESEGHFNGKVFLLTNVHTFSSASDFSWTFKECGMGTIVGEETGGVNVSFGDMVYYNLPYSGLTLTCSWKRFWRYGADENDIHGTIPDYIVPEKEALTKALELCRQLDTKGKKI